LHAFYVYFRQKDNGRTQQRETQKNFIRKSLLVDFDDLRVFSLAMQNKLELSCLVRQTRQGLVLQLSSDA